MKTRNLLRRLRRAIRSLYLIHGLLIVLLYACALLTLVYVGDRLLDYPRELRIVQIALFGGLSAYVVYRFLVKPAFLTKIDDDDLAVLVERTHPHLRERFITVLQAERNPAIRASSEPAFLESMRLKLEQDLRTLRARRALRFRGITRKLALTFACVGLVAVGAAFQSEYLPIFWQRLAGLDVPWPRETTIVLTLRDRDGNLLQARLEDGTVQPAEGLRLGTYQVELPRFNSMRVEVRAEGVAPETAYLRTEGDRIDEVTRSTQEQKGNDGADFLHTYREIARDFSFWVEAGDDDDRHPTIVVSTYEPPVIRGVWATITPPTYLPPLLVDRMTTTLPHGNVKALQGSSAKIHLLVDGAVTKATVTCEPAPDASWGSARDLERVTLAEAPPLEVWRGEDWQRLTAFVIEGLPIVGDSTFQYRVHLFDKKERPSERPNVYLVTPERDDPPSVSLRVLGTPGGTISTRGSVLAVVEARDAFDLASVSLGALDERVERDADGERIARWTRELLIPEDRGALERRRTEDGRTVYFLHDREDLDVLKRDGVVTDQGAVVTLQAVARDGNPAGRATRSGVVQLNVLDLSDYLRVLERSLKEIRAESEALRLRETEFLATVRATHRAIDEAASPGDWSREDVRFDRYAETQDARRIAMRFSTVLQGVLLNRIGSDISEGAAEATTPGEPTREKTTREIAALDQVYQEVFGRAGVRDLGLMAEEEAIFVDLAILARLGRDPAAISTETATKSLLAIGGDLATLVETHFKGVNESAETLIGLDGREAILEELSKLEQRQSVLLDALTKILDSLNRWDSFESILLDWRKATDELARYRRLLDGTDN